MALPFHSSSPAPSNCSEFFRSPSINPASHAALVSFLSHSSIASSVRRSFRLLAFLQVQSALSLFLPSTESSPLLFLCQLCPFGHRLPRAATFFHFARLNRAQAFFSWLHPPILEDRKTHVIRSLGKSKPFQMSCQPFQVSSQKFTIFKIAYQ